MIESSDARSVVITGLGVLAPCGLGLPAFWKGLGEAAEPQVLRRIADFDPEQHGVARTEARRLDRFAQFALGAARCRGSNRRSCEPIRATARSHRSPCPW